MNINVKAAVALSLLCVPHLKKEKGCMVNVSSVSAHKPMKERLFYCMSKASLDMFTKCMALELAPFGVRINSVNPGVVETNVHRDRGQEYANKYFSGAASRNPSGRNATVEEVANLILHYASDQSSFVTGNCTVIDGGISLQ